MQQHSCLGQVYIAPLKGNLSLLFHSYIKFLGLLVFLFVCLFVFNCSCSDWAFRLEIFKILGEGKKKKKDI